MSEVKLSKPSPTRCPFCHDSVAAGLLVRCKCGAVYHAECAQGLSKCASCPETAGFGSYHVVAITPQIIDELIHKIEINSHWNEAWDIARSNSKGKVWLVGGKVYRTLTEIMFGTPAGAQGCDFDFITAKATWFNHVPAKWYVVVNDDYGETRINPYTTDKTEHAWRYFREGRQLLDLLTFGRATQAGFEASLDGYFKSVPLDVQAVALDVENRQLSGPGLKAICRRVLGVNNLKQAEGAAKRASLTLSAFVEARALSLGFQASTVVPSDKKAGAKL